MHCAFLNIIHCLGCLLGRIVFLNHSVLIASEAYVDRYIYIHIWTCVMVSVVDIFSSTNLTRVCVHTCIMYILSGSICIYLSVMLLCTYIEVQVPNTRNKVWNLDLGERMENSIV